MKKPNIKGPRFRSKRLSVLNKKTYQDFIKKYPEYEDLDLESFKNIIRTYNDELCNTIIDNRNGVELPDGLGFVFIGTCPKSKKENIDFKKSIEYGTKVFYRNFDSDNKLMKIFYSNYAAKYPFHNKQLWSFRLSKPVRQRASKEYKENWTRYLEVPRNAKIASLFEENRKKNYVKNMKPIIPEGYDEFKL